MASTVVGLAVAALAQGALLSAQTVDRSVQPKPGADVSIKIPTWTRTTLPNGAQLVVAQKRDLPLVSFSLSFVGGNYNYESADKVGVGALAASMVSEGTTTKTAEQISDAQQLLGTSIGSFIGGESGTIAFSTMADKFAPTLALVADMLLNPAFPNEALERNRGRTVINITQSKDQPNAIAAKVFGRVLYGDNHPYGRIATEESVRGITRDDVMKFYRAYYEPGHAIITVAGDVDPKVVAGEVTKAFANWKPTATRPAVTYPATPVSRPTTIYLVDKPGAAQSVFTIGLPGPSRDTPDYYALQVMNTILGGLFQSRINHDIREVKGWSYGTRSSFGYGRGPGAFQAGGGIVTAKSDSALIAFMSHLKGVQGSVPFTADEIEQGKSSLVQGLVNRFGSVGAVGNSVAAIYSQGLPEDYYGKFTANVNGVTTDDMTRVAKKYIDLGHLNIVIVGDRKVIEAPLRATGIAPIVVLDPEGRSIVP